MSDSLEPCAINWRSLLNSIQAPWIDRGRNCSRNNVNVNCPSCGNDDGYHLRISEEYEIFNCWRDRRHGGTSFIYLLQQLGCTRNESIKLLNEFRQNIQPVAKAAPAPLADLTKTWNVFSRLADADADHPVVKYWITRGFDDPQAVADKYDLRYTQYGEWAMRVLLPLYYDGAIRTWTGRAASKQLDLRYKTNDIGDRSQLYIPAPPREVLYLVEGPIDALKITVALEGTAASAVALCSKDLNDSRILRLIGLGCKEVRVLFDNDAPLSQQFSTLNTLASHLRTCNVTRWRLPARYKDAAEAPEHELKALLGV